MDPAVRQFMDDGAGADDTWEWDPGTGVLTLVDEDRKWKITAEPVSPPPGMESCPGQGSRWFKSLFFGIPLCPKCLQSWSEVGLKEEPSVTGSARVPVHYRKPLSFRNEPEEP